jgi:hypothetical protein
MVYGNRSSKNIEPFFGMLCSPVMQNNNMVAMRTFFFAFGLMALTKDLLEVGM